MGIAQLSCEVRRDGLGRASGPGAESERAAFLSFLVADRLRLRGELVGLHEAEGFRRNHSELESRRLALENRLYQSALESQVQAQADRMEEVLLQGAQALARALEAKDPSTWGHSARVSECSAAIARELGLSEEEVKTVALGGELHDVGKIGVREDLLCKPGPLTVDEYHQVMEHTVIGTRILTPLLHNHPELLCVVRSHHERVDGSGFPDGLRGEEIALAARIVAVADAFDAMTTARPYRSTLTGSDALRELERNAGSQFDRDCVLAFLPPRDAKTSIRVLSRV